jgi:hypothetical protein
MKIIIILEHLYGRENALTKRASKSKKARLPPHGKPMKSHIGGGLEAKWQRREKAVAQTIQRKLLQV